MSEDRSDKDNASFLGIAMNSARERELAEIALPTFTIEEMVRARAQLKKEIGQQPDSILLTQDQRARVTALRNAENEIVWHEQAAKALRDLGVNSGIPLSVIARAAKGEIYYKLRVPDRYIEEYKKWRNVWEVSKRILKGK